MSDFPSRFRVWDGQDMHYPEEDSLHAELYQDGSVTGCYSDTGAVTELGELEVMFSTGLTDAEGNEIWEGDVVKLVMYSGVVQWNNQVCGFVIDVPQAPNLTKLTRAGIEDGSLLIEGNRYENPGLLDEVNA